MDLVLKKTPKFCGKVLILGFFGIFGYVEIHINLQIKWECYSLVFIVVWESCNLLLFRSLIVIIICMSLSCS